MGLAPDSPATKAGLEIDDIIISYQDTAVENMSQLIGLIQRSKINESIALEIWRQGTKRSLQAVIGKAADYNKDDVQLGNNQPESDVKLEPQTILEAIGLYVRDSSPAERAKGVGNVIVSKVNSASPLADKLLIGDQVLAINNHLVQRSDDFLLRLIASAAKQNTELKIRRGNTTFPVIIPQVMSRN